MNNAIQMADTAQSHKSVKKPSLVAFHQGDASDDTPYVIFPDGDRWYCPVYRTQDDDANPFAVGVNLPKQSRDDSREVQRAKKTVHDFDAFVKQVEASRLARIKCKKELIKRISLESDDRKRGYLESSLGNLVITQAKREAIDEKQITELKADAAAAESFLMAEGYGNAGLGKNGVLSTPASESKNDNLKSLHSLQSLLAEQSRLVKLSAARKVTDRKRSTNSSKELLIKENRRKDARLDDFVLQNIVREILPESPTATCLYAKRGFGNVDKAGNPIEAHIEVCKKQSEGAGRATYRGLQTCKSAWNCPICAKRIANERRAEIVGYMNKHRATGGSVFFVTFTFPHNRTQELNDSMEKLALAEKYLKSGKGWSLIEDKFGILGTIRNIEVMLGLNGWHPHIHSVFFLKDGHKGVDLEALRAALFDKWSSACVRAGLDAPSDEHGVDVRRGDAATNYITKFGLENELTGWQAKVGGKSISPFDLLRIYKKTDNRGVKLAAKNAFREYSEAFRYKKQLVISRKLMELYGESKNEGDNAIDGEIVQEIQEVDECWYRFTEQDWRYIRNAGLRGTVLELASQSVSKEECAMFINCLVEHGKDYQNARNFHAIYPIVDC